MTETFTLQEISMWVAFAGSSGRPAPYHRITLGYFTTKREATTAARRAQKEMGGDIVVRELDVMEYKHIVLGNEELCAAFMGILNRNKFAGRM